MLPEAQAPQPDRDIHHGAHNRWWRIIFWGSESVQGGVGDLRASQSLLRLMAKTVFSPFLKCGG
jgi:hypothetical protein